MKIPKEPPIGNIVAYEYLWHSKVKSREDGAKVYPTALILSKAVDFGSQAVYALGISHMEPPPNRRALEVPPKLRRWIGLDNDPQWIYTDEVNIFTWPGPDLRPAQWISQRELQEDTCVLGVLPYDWYSTVAKHLAESYRMGMVRVVKRTQ